MHAAVTRRMVLLVLVGALLLAGFVFVTGDGGSDDAGGTGLTDLTGSDVPATAGPSGSDAAPTTTTTEPPPTTTTTVPKGPSDALMLTQVRAVTGTISPKSVMATNRGLVFAQNMMYTHTVTVYDGAGDLVATIPDEVNLAAFGFPEYPSPVKGAPVEAAVSADGTHVYVSNYSMYGPGFGPEGTDTCTPRSGFDDSFVYRIDVATMKIDQAIKVGAVPKYVATSPDGKWLVVTNWCSYDASLVDVATGKEVKRIPIGSYPRGVAIDPTSTMAYIAQMGGQSVFAVNLKSFAVDQWGGLGGAPRHVVLDPTGRWLYVTFNYDGTVGKVDVTTGEVVGVVHTGKETRSLAVSADGRSLYVVNYDSNTMTKVRAADLAILQEVHTGTHPIGVTYDATTGYVWVCDYVGTIHIYAEA